MRLVVLFILFTLFWGGICCQNYQPVGNLSSIKFSIKNFGLSVVGHFSGINGDIKFNSADISSASFNANIDANSIHTGNEARDKHLRKEEYFNVIKYPVISMVSKQVLVAGAPGSYTMIANITIKGITKEIQFPFMAKSQNGGVLFSGEYKLNRRDFGVGGSSLVLADNLIVVLSVFGKKDRLN